MVTKPEDLIQYVLKCWSSQSMVCVGSTKPRIGIDAEVKTRMPSSSCFSKVHSGTIVRAIRRVSIITFS